MNLQIFEQNYKTIAKSDANDVLKAVTLKNEIIVHRRIINEIGTKDQIHDFEELVLELSNYFNIERNISRITDSFICIQFEKDTFYYYHYGDETICGNLIEIIEDVSTNRKGDSGEFLESIAPFGIKLECQYGELDIAIGDFKSIERI